MCVRVVRLIAGPVITTARLGLGCIHSTVHIDSFPGTGRKVRQVGSTGSNNYII